VAVLLARADGNLTAAATWGTVDATALLNSSAANTVLTTSYVESAAFTPGAITIDGIAVCIASRAASPSGTMSVRLAQGGATVAGTEVTINVSDIEADDIEQGWYLFSFPSVLLIIATAYTVSAKTSAATQVNLYRNATAGNWSRMLRTTTTAAPGAGDMFHICGEKTSAGAETARVVTMNSTAATDYGDGVAISTSAPFGCTVGDGGSLVCGVTASTTYILQLSTDLTTWKGSTLTFGASGAPVPRTSTATLQFDCAADGDFGLRVGGTFNLTGESRTTAKNVVQCLLNTDEAVAQTTLGVDTDTGWLSGDEIGIAPTTRTATQHELRILNANAGASSMDITVGLTNAHSGTSPTQAEVILITRNVVVRSVSTSFMSYCNIRGRAGVTCEWAGFRYLGSSAATERGVEISSALANGSASFTYCAFSHADNDGFYVANPVSNLTITDCVAYALGGNTAGTCVVMHTATQGSASVTRLTIIGAAGNGAIGFDVTSASIGGPLVTGLRVSGCDGIGIRWQVVGSMPGWSAIHSHSNNDSGFQLFRSTTGRMDDIHFWRNFYGLEVHYPHTMIINSGQIFGNGGGGDLTNIHFGAETYGGEVILRALTVAGDSTFATEYGLVFQDSNIAGACRVRLEGCSFGAASGIFVAHTVSDVHFDNGDSHQHEITLVNTTLASTTEIENTSAIGQRGFIAYQRQDGTTNVHLTNYPALGTVQRDTTVFRSASPSEKLTPSGATSYIRLRCQERRVPVPSGSAISVSCYVRKTSAYTGSSPRLVQLANYAIGVTDDVVVATHTAAADTWERLSGTTTAASEDGVCTFVVEVDGSAGAVYVDDWSAAEVT
jgi:hypothetical protein